MHNLHIMHLHENFGSPSYRYNLIETFEACPGVVVLHKAYSN